LRCRKEKTTDLAGKEERANRVYRAIKVERWLSVVEMEINALKAKKCDVRTAGRLNEDAYFPLQEESKILIGRDSEEI
jgi:hypothetical protein